MINYLWLFDSRSRSITNKRRVTVYPNTPQGYKAAWMFCLNIEVKPDEIEDYMYLTETNDLDPDCEDGCAIFNDYWACYGWCLGVYDNNTPPEIDCEVVETNNNM